MSAKNFIKENLVLLIGLALPVLLMAGFFVVSVMPNVVSDPPKYSLVFAVPDNISGASAMPYGVRLVVKDGLLKAQYTKTNPQQGYYYAAWKKLYLYDAQTRQVRQLTFGFPENVSQEATTWEETVEATKDLKLSTTLQAPDGYELSYDGYSRSGLLDGVLFGHSYSSEPRLSKGSSHVKLSTGDNRTYFYYGNIEFIGWVVP